ncbi:putative hexapeptide transferase [Magnetofaba australis IT-1]|uniref:Putative hexapeptide transferase n=1 Tax=Magnetofaba australis IT-1 TaxID=1434232 RepID=A0A1Y2K2C6_9PROT|nr:putative hexapeptide transferase [Magnetofaba australis IT-1]
MVCACARACGWGARLLGYLAPEPSALMSELKLEHLGDDDALERFAPDQVALLNGIGSVGDPSRRRRAHDAAAAQGFAFPVLTHPTAIIDPTALLSEGAQIMAGAIVQIGARIHAGALINTGARIDHHCFIGDHVHIAPGAVLCGQVTVETGAHVGAGATLIQGVRVGQDALVGAGAVVVGNVSSGMRTIGVPARESAL